MVADPRARFQSAAELRLALRQYLLMRRAAPLVGTLALLLALGVPAWALWPRSSGSDLDESVPPVAGREKRSQQPTSEPATSAAPARDAIRNPPLRQA